MNGWRCRSSRVRARQAWAIECSTIFQPIARRLVAKCDGCLRIGGRSAGADEMVALARQHGKAVYHSLEEVPRAGFNSVNGIRAIAQAASESGSCGCFRAEWLVLTSLSNVVLGIYERYGQRREPER
jgi:hypothetical protein